MCQLVTTNLNEQQWCVVTQGSFLGPFLFKKDTYITINPGDYGPIQALNNCIEQISDWMCQNSQIKQGENSKNDSITQFGANNERLDVCAHLEALMFKTSNHARNFGVILDLNFKTHINRITKSAYYHVQNIARLKGPMSQQDIEKLHAFVFSRLDYCNSVFTGVCKKNQSDSCSLFRTLLPESSLKLKKRNTSLAHHQFSEPCTGFLCIKALISKDFHWLKQHWMVWSHNTSEPNMQKPPSVSMYHRSGINFRTLESAATLCSFKSRLKTFLFASTFSWKMLHFILLHNLLYFYCSYLFFLLQIVLFSVLFDICFMPLCMKCAI